MGSGLDLKGGDVNDRMGFVKKVYLILFAQLAITFAWTFICITSTSMASWMIDNWWMYLITVIVAVVVQLMLICKRDLARKVPVNYICLLIFTICESYFVGWLCQYYTYDPYYNSFNSEGYRTVGMAAGFTLAITAGLTAYAWTTKADFTRKMGFMWVLGMTFFMLCIFSIFFYSYVLQMFLCALGVLIFGLYLVIDTQLILGEGRHKLSIDDYILGAMILYVDIIMIFVYLLQLLGGR